MTLAWLLLALSAQAADVVLVPPGDTWRFLDSGVDPDPTWSSPAYDDSGWTQGAARLGYGDSEIVTTVDYGPDAADKHITTCASRTSTAADVNRAANRPRATAQ